MGWRMKIFNIFLVHRKIWVLGGSSWKKTIYRGDCIKRGDWTSCRWGAWEERGGGVFEGVDIPMHTMNLLCSSPHCTFTMQRHCNTTYIYIPPLTDFQNTITVTKLLMKRLSEKICNKNECHEAKLVSIFPMNFFVKRNKFVSSISSILGTSLFRRKIGSIISICLKLGLKGIKDVK